MVGHNADFDQIFQKHWAELYSFAYNIMRDKAVAEDIVQEVFIDFWNRKIVVELPRAYLFQAIRNQCAKALYNRRFDSVQVEKLASILPDLDEVQYDEVKTMLLDEIEKTALAILPDRCLLIFKMRFYEQRSYKDIAQCLGITESTVENQITKALRMLKESTPYVADISGAILLLLWSNVN
ncbi:MULTISPECIES: sigma-70 family RNA polymerase sigma factor [unclassified Myroides]|uniref:sigma-70 family RNA polymerase sigma factor n=1 Tax=unclassified Myroides TaxID=2642485 RepID=UPI003D2F6108